MWHLSALLYSCGYQIRWEDCLTFASLVCCLTLCEWRGVLHMGDRAAVVPLHVYSARSKPQTYIYPNFCLLWMVFSIVHSPASLVQEDRHAAVILQWEGSGDHLPHKMKRANETAQSHHTFSKIFHRDQKSGCILWIFGWLMAQKCFTNNKVHSQLVWEHLARSTVPSSVISGDSKFGTL